MSIMDASKHGLTLEQLGDIARKALTNARDLLDEAKELARLNSPRALSLAVLAGEEFGKHMMCFSAVSIQPDDDPGWLKFRRRFRDHKPKHMNMMAIASSPGVADEDPASTVKHLPQAVRAGQKLKMAGFYVDMDEEGNAVEPSDVIDSTLADVFINFYDSVVSEHEVFWAGADFQSLFEDNAIKVRELMAQMEDEVTRGSGETTD